MKTRLLAVILLLLILGILLSRNSNVIVPMILNFTNPLKQGYNKFSQNIENKSNSYLFQKDAIETLTKENKELKKLLLEQAHYIKQIKNIYTILPDLPMYPARNVAIVDTISYVKLNSFSQVILTKPKDLQEKKLYGLIRDNAVGGTATIKNNQLYGRLTSDEKCRFSVFVGKNNAPGIAQGLDKNTMEVKFIPTWHDIKEGDRVYTSGLDNIFFAGMGVGKVSKVETKNAYKVATIETYNTIYNPRSFLLITDAKATLARHIDPKNIRISSRPPLKVTSKPLTPQPILEKENNTTQTAPVRKKDKNENEKKDIVVQKTEKSIFDMMEGVSQNSQSIEQTKIDNIEPTQESEEKIQKRKIIPKQDNATPDLF